MPARKILACVSLIAFAVAAQPAFAQNGDNAPATSSSGGATNPSTAPAQRAHKQHSGRHRRQQTQQAPQTGGSN